MLRLSIVAALLFPCLAQAGDYRLGPADHVQVKVVEWRASVGEAHEWSSITGEYVVNASGQIFLPLVGPIDAAGLDLPELSRAISEGVRQRVGLLEAPDASVQVVQFRPFYVVGSVSKPGEYSYETGLNVLRAVSMAGGLARPNGPDMRYLEGEAVSERGNLNVLNVHKNTLLARRARLQAEERQDGSITFPPELADRKDDATIAQDMRDEESIFDSHRTELKTQLDALSGLGELLKQQVAVLKARLETQNRELGLIEQELTGVTSLVQKGLAVAPQELVLEQSAAELEGGRLELEMAVLQAQEDLSRAEREADDLVHQKQAEAALEIGQVQSEIDQTDLKLVETERLLYETEVVEPQAVEERIRALQQSRPVYVLVRHAAGKDEEAVVAEDTPVQPGDVLRIEIPQTTAAMGAGERPLENAR